MLVVSYLITFLLSSTAKAQRDETQARAPDSCSLASFDRCGPANQAPGTASTCNATVAASGSPSVYGVQCKQNLNIQSGLNYQNCLVAATDICNKLTDPHVLKDRWIWTNPTIMSCAFGFWLPSGNGSDAAFAPEYNRCMVGIFQPMAQLCTNPSWNNVGGVNIKVMPNSTTTGEAVDPYYPSYVIAPSSLTPYAF
ncbi:MAG: hypothetical protein Q9225_005963 [Loekoesia sp. 1 TL-2023]